MPREVSVKKLIVTAGIVLVAVAVVSIIFMLVARKSPLDISKEVRGFFEGLAD
jgi:hypothetical protein